MAARSHVSASVIDVLVSTWTGNVGRHIHRHFSYSLCQVQTFQGMFDLVRPRVLFYDPSRTLTAGRRIPSNGNRNGGQVDTCRERQFRKRSAAIEGDPAQVAD